MGSRRFVLRVPEAELDELPGFVTDIAGADVHYLRFDAERPDALPPELLAADLAAFFRDLR